MRHRMLRSRWIDTHLLRISLTRIGAILACGVATYAGRVYRSLNARICAPSSGGSPHRGIHAARAASRNTARSSTWSSPDGSHWTAPRFSQSVLFPDTIVTAVTNGSKSHHEMALVTSYQGRRFHPETVRGLATDSAALGHTAGEIASLVAGSGYRGIVLDLEGMTPNDLTALFAFTKAVADSAHAHRIAQVGLAIPATDTAAYPARPLLSPLDFLVVMLYDQHWLTSPPGPIAAPDWVRRVLSIRIGEVGAGKLVAAFPTYSYQWQTDSATAVLSYYDARQRAANAHVGLERDPASITLHTQAPGWTIWVSDAVLLDSLVRDARISGVTKFALWRLGLEDPAVWTGVIGQRDNPRP